MIAIGGITAEVPQPTRVEAAVAVVWFGLYMGLQSLGPESEAGHWLTLVAIPLLLVMLVRLRLAPRQPLLPDILASVGLRRGHLRDGLAWAIPLGLLLSTATLWLSRSGAAFLERASSPAILALLPIAFLFLLATAAFTEELFFRGVLQRRLEARLGPWAALLVAAVAFGLYHVPYAYLDPDWPTYGNAAAALRLGLVEGGIGGLITGLVFIGARRNLLAPVLVHALIDLFPAVAMIRFGGG